MFWKTEYGTKGNIGNKFYKTTFTEGNRIEETGFVRQSKEGKLVEEHLLGDRDIKGDGI
jgi:hypothetical protein